MGNILRDWAQAPTLLFFNGDILLVLAKNQVALHKWGSYRGLLSAGTLSLITEGPFFSRTLKAAARTTRRLAVFQRKPSSHFQKRLLVQWGGKGGLLADLECCVLYSTCCKYCAAAWLQKRIYLNIWKLWREAICFLPTCVYQSCSIKEGKHLVRLSHWLSHWECAEIQAAPTPGTTQWFIYSQPRKRGVETINQSRCC